MPGMGILAFRNKQLLAEYLLWRKAAFGRGCVKTFLSATGTQNQTENRASTQNPHL
jgi:hypothetical protein